jgi:hypothetical protein
MPLLFCERVFIGKEQMSKVKETVSLDVIWQSMASEAAGFYKTIIVTASSFLGGSLLFMKDIAPNPLPITLGFLSLGWMALILSIILVAKIRWHNVESGRLVLEDQVAEAQKMDQKNRGRTNFSIYCLAFGMFFVMLFGIVNVSWEKKKESNMAKSQNNTEKRVLVEKSLPFGDLRGSMPFGSLSTSEGSPTASQPTTVPQAQVSQSTTAPSTTSSGGTSDKK